MKPCAKCGDVKPLTEFFADRSKKHGYAARCKQCKREDHREYLRRTDGHRRRYQKNRLSERERHLVRKYGVTLAVYDEMYAEQGGRCAICEKQQKRSFDVDHNHETGEVRGLLCTSCNRVLGHAGDSAERLMAAAEYLTSRRSPRRSSKRTSTDD